MNAQRKPVLPGQDSFLPSAAEMARRRRWRYLADAVAGWTVRAGGGGVVVALALIFVYLFSEVVPILRGASLDPIAQYAAPGESPAARSYLTLERYDELGMRYTDTGRLDYFRLADGEPLVSVDPGIAEDRRVTTLAVGEPRARRAAIGLDDGRAIVIDHQVRLDFSGEARRVLPDPQFPLGRDPLEIDPQGQALQVLAVQRAGDDTGVAALTADGRLLFVRFSVSTAFLTGETEVRARRWEIPTAGVQPERLQLSANLWTLIGADARGRLVYCDLSYPASAVLRVQSVAV